MAKFSQYAIAAARQAIQDSNWKPETDREKQRTVRILLLYKKKTQLLKLFFFFVRVFV